MIFKPCSKGLPLAAGGIVFALLSGLAVADSPMEVIYGKWVKIDPSQMLKELPRYDPPRSTPGSVTTEYRRKPEGHIQVHSFQNPVPSPVKVGSK